MVAGGLVDEMTMPPHYLTVLQAIPEIPGIARCKKLYDITAGRSRQPFCNTFQHVMEAQVWYYN